MRSIRFSQALASVAIIVFSTACAGPGTYRYANHVLIPPGVKNPDLPKRTQTVAVGAACRASEGGVRIQPAGSSMKVTVEPKALAANPPGWLSRWTVSLEKRDCIHFGDSLALATRIAEIVPLDPKVASALLRPSITAVGYLDLDPEYRLKVVGPILREGAKPNAAAIGAPATVSGSARKLTLELRASTDFVGYETAWYTIRANPGRPGTHITPLSADDNINGKVTRAERPRVEYLLFSSSAAYFRLFYLTRISKSDHDIALLAAATRTELEDRTERFESDPARYASANPGMCVMIPRTGAVTPYIVVTVNGSEVAVSIGGTLRGALKEAGIPNPEAALASLKLQRRYAGQLVAVTFDRSRPDILDLPLTGSESIVIAR